MAPFLSHLMSSSLLPSDDKLLSSLQTKNKEQLEKLEADLEDAKTNLGETEISDALRAKALYLARIGEKVRRVLLSSLELCLGFGEALGRR